jgi:hypothetical protein
MGTEQTPSWHVTVCVHRPITGAQADGLFDTLADAAYDWEPAGVDVDVSGGPCCCRESPAAVARVVDAAREVARVLRPAVSRPSRALVAAVDALEEVAGHVAAVDLDLPCTVDGCQRARPCPTHDHHRAGVPAEPGEPDADPATERDFDSAAAAGVPVAVVGTPPWQVHDSPPPTHGTPAAAPADGPDQERELDAARAELAEVTAERDRYRQSLPVEAQDYWYWRQRAETAEARVDELADAHGWSCPGDVREERRRIRMEAADVRAGQRTIPTPPASRQESATTEET